MNQKQIIMKKENIEKLIKVLYLVSAIIIIIGAYLKITLNQMGSSLFTFGLILQIILQWIENSRLKKIITNYESL